MKTYIIRIYRFEDGNPFNLVGLVEEVGVEGRKKFNNYEELWNILKTSPFFSEEGEEQRGSIKKKSE